MLIYLSFFMAVGLYLSSMFLKKGRRVGVIVFAILFVLTTVGVTANYFHHWGMKKVTTTKSQRIYSAAGKNLPINLYQPVGTSGKDNVFIYKTTPNQGKTIHTQANELTYSQAKTSTTNTAYLTTTETRWHYQNVFYKFLFIGTGMQNKLVHRTNTLYYPKGYVRLTVKQASQLKKRMTNSNQATSAIKQQMTTYVQQKIAAANTRDPQKIKQISQQAQLEFQGQMINKLLQ